ncbi:hypothetical protein CW697_09500 [Macrococcoides caseolyticum]|uniref:hypothetical protein n=1 Tax=Macrococcoides caseolyticum TaxID=69966 RepID=UPI000C33AEAB|nr:hypothetical protein [Macrococcus caseolyticus]PKF29202.1 hypothetical protein CW697_09500 [Macrococcus caseolyticus]
MSTNWDAVKEDYDTGKFKLKDLAEKHDIKLGTLKSKISREGWNKVATKKKDATKKVAKKKHPQDTTDIRRKSGNPNPPNQFTERNNFAVKHGLLSRYIPKETMELMGIADSMDAADIIWAQIQIQFAAIIRAQKVMWVEDANDHTSGTTGVSMDGESMKVAFAYEKYASFLSAQSRAMAELRSALKQFSLHAADDDYRKLQVAVMHEQLTQIKQQNENGAQSDKPLEILITRKEGRE